MTPLAGTGARPGSRPPGVRSLRAAVLALLAGAVSLTAVEVVLLLTGPAAAPRWVAVLFPIVAVVYFLMGTVAWLRRPGNRFGLLMVFAGFSWIAAGFANASHEVLVGVGLICATLPIAIVVHLLHAFPGGRLVGRLSTATVLAGYGVCLLLQPPQYLFGQGPEAAVPFLQVASRPDLADAGLWAQLACGTVVMALTAALLSRRVTRLPPSARPGLVPLFAYGVAAVLFVPLSGKLAGAVLGIDPIPVGLEVAQLAVLTGVPVAFTAVIMRGSFAPTAEIEELAVRFGEESASALDPQGALAAALGDPSLRLLLWSEEQGELVDAEGRSAPPPGAGSERGRVGVELEGRMVGAIDYDATLIGDPETVRVAGRVAAVALDRVRVIAELRAGEHKLRRSRARLARAADAERRRIARDLHDGLQTELVLLSIEADGLREGGAGDGRSESATALHEGLIHAIEELRTLVHGLMPALLAEQGLAHAIEGLARRLPIPTELRMAEDLPELSPAVESAVYMLLAEAVTNVVKHAEASGVIVDLVGDEGIVQVAISDDGRGGARIAAGAGLRTMTDRVEALGGTLALRSPPGVGTTIRAELPCGS